MVRVAQLVYDCIPNAGSDPGIGWHAVVSASQAGIEVHALTKASNREAIAAHPPLNNVTWHYIDVPESAGPISTGNTTGDVVHLWRWLKDARDLCERFAEQDVVDLVHFVTFSAFWMPVPLANVALPTVFGPVGGGERVPPVLENDQRDKFAAIFRNLVQSTFMKVPTWRSLTSAPDTIVTSASHATTKRLAGQGVTVFETRAPGCLTNEMIDQLSEIEPIRAEHPTLVVSGRQLRWKGHDLAISALPLVLDQEPNARLEVLGNGPRHDALKSLAQELGVTASVVFRSGIDRVEERRRIAGADVFVLPSRRDAGSTLLPLVQVLGVPIAALDTGAIPDVTGGFAYIGDPSSAPPHAALASAICQALDASPDVHGPARAFAIQRFGETSAGEALHRWYAAALATT